MTDPDFTLLLGRPRLGDMEKASTGSGEVAEVESLRERHAELERRLSSLDKHLSLTPDEQLERARIKKEKLWVKDRMMALGALGRG
jgi:hypothetical protein